MAVKNLVYYPDPILRETCAPLEEFDAELGEILDDLGESMYANKGVGLAGPQIGVLQRVAVVDVEQREGNPRLIELVNPVLEEFSEQTIVGEEGCLSFPGEFEKVVRPLSVKVSAHDRNGRQFVLEAEGFFARALVHEIEHLNGVVLVDHLSRLKRSLIERRMKKRAKREGA